MKKKKKRAEHPTLFVFEGSLRHFKDGSMLELHTQVTNEEWQLIVNDTIRYKLFVEVLKEIACPLLHEKWTKEDDWYRLQLEIAISRIRNIDPLLVASFKQDDIKKSYIAQANEGAVGMIEAIKKLRDVKFETGANRETPVSDL